MEGRMDRRTIITSSFAALIGGLISTRLNAADLSNVKSVGNVLMSQPKLVPQSTNIYQTDLKQVLGCLIDKQGDDFKKSGFSLLGKDLPQSTFEFKLKENNTVYREVSETTNALKAIVPFVDFNFGTSEKAVVNISQTGVVFVNSNYTPSYEKINQLIPASYAKADQLLWITGASLWLVSVDIYSTQSTAANIFQVLSIGGSKYYQSTKNYNYPVITLQTDLVYPFGRAATVAAMQEQGIDPKAAASQVNQQLAASIQRASPSVMSYIQEVDKAPWE
jgi:hypothetical protein